MREHATEEAGKTADAAREIRSEQFSLLIEQSYPAAYISLVVAAMLVMFLWSAQDHGVLMTWAVCVVLAGLARLVVFWQNRRSPPSLDEVPARERRYFAAMMVYFLCWGVGGVWIMPADSAVHQVTVLYFLIGLAGSAIAVFSANRLIQLTAVSSLLLPILGWFYFRGDSDSIAVAVAGTVFLLSAIRSSKVLSRAMGQNLMLKHELMEAKTRAEHLARIDALTGLCNRRAFYEYGERLIAQARRSQDGLAVIMLDVDHFKRINDEHGHTVGDKALQHLSGILSHSLRATDLCGRIGGEEFAIILPGTGLEAGVRVAESLRQRLADAPLGLGTEALQLTASFGVAAGTQPVDALVKAADEALYRAKNGGRNRVEFSGHIEQPRLVIHNPGNGQPPG